MKTILLFGAGKSATVLIHYLLQQAGTENWQVWVIDANLDLAQSKIGKSPYGKALSFDITNEEERKRYLPMADLVISLLSPALHLKIAEDCISYQKNLLTASYIDAPMKSLVPEVVANNLLFLCEMGLDPGIDHMSAKRLIDRIQDNGGKITSFMSHCGGLVAPESDDNPWHYKISWNPQNVVNAGKGGAVFRRKGIIQSLNYEAVFSEKRWVNIPDYGFLCWYPNRNSLPYLQVYGLEDCSTFIRTTLRHPDFISAWKKIIDLQLTDEQPLYETDEKTLAQLIEEHLRKHGLTDWLTKVEKATNSRVPEGHVVLSNSLKSEAEDSFLKQLIWLGIKDKDTKINKGRCSASAILQFALEQKLTLQPHDSDMIIMMHEIEFEKDGRRYKSESTMINIGKNNLETAMASTVGLPLGIAAKLILNGTITLKGLHIPVKKEIYTAILEELKNYGIDFKETVHVI